MDHNVYLISREFAHAWMAAGLVAFPVLFFFLCPVIYLSTIAATPSHIGMGPSHIVDTLACSAASLLMADSLAKKGYSYG
jgi:hypothetical protein